MSVEKLVLSSQGFSNQSPPTVPPHLTSWRILLSPLATSLPNSPPGVGVHVGVLEREKGKMYIHTCIYSPQGPCFSNGICECVTREADRRHYVHICAIGMPPSFHVYCTNLLHAFSPLTMSYLLGLIWDTDSRNAIYMYIHVHPVWTCTGSFLSVYVVAAV